MVNNPDKTEEIIEITGPASMISSLRIELETGKIYFPTKNTSIQNIITEILVYG